MERSHANVSCIQLGCSLLTFKHNKNFLCASQPWLFYISRGILKSFLGSWVSYWSQDRDCCDRFFPTPHGWWKKVDVPRKNHRFTGASCFVLHKARNNHWQETVAGPHFANVWTLLSKDEQSNSPWLTMPKVQQTGCGEIYWTKYILADCHGFHRQQTQVYIPYKS